MSQRATLLEDRQGQVVRFLLNDKESDQKQILRLMDRLSAQYSREPLVREFTVRIMAGLSNNDIQGQVRRAFQYVKDNVTYIRDPEGSEYLQSPIRMIQDHVTYGYMMGDCDDHVLLLNTMLGSIGIPSRAVGVKFGGSFDFNHVISGVACCGTAILLDPCAKSNVVPHYSETLTA